VAYQVTRHGGIDNQVKLVSTLPYRLLVTKGSRSRAGISTYRGAWPGVPAKAAHSSSEEYGAAHQALNYRLYPLNRNVALLRAGTYITLSDSVLAQGMRNISRAVGPKNARTIEDVLRSSSLTIENATRAYVANSSIVFPDLQYMLHSNFLQHRPAIGCSCFYEKRAGEAGYIPDCTGVSAAAAQKASWMVQAGLQFAISDGTNRGLWPSSASDVLQMRPAEVLAREWMALS